MNAYGSAAISAAHQVCRWSKDPQSAWFDAVTKQFPHSPAAQAKGCPRAAFLALCSDGVVAGIPPGWYTRSKLNRAYAVKAARLLQIDASLAGNRAKLWSECTAPHIVQENSQLDVVLALWSARLLTPANNR
jgi:hypothetical protein